MPSSDVSGPLREDRLHGPALTVSVLAAFLTVTASFILASGNLSLPWAAVSLVLIVCVALALASSRERTQAFTPVIAFAAFMFTRPMILGESWGLLGGVLWILAAASVLLGVADRRRMMQKLKPGLMVALIYWTYVAALDAARGGSPQAALAPLGALLIALTGAWCVGSVPSVASRVWVLLKIALTIPIVGYVLLLIHGFGGLESRSFSMARFGGRETEYVVWPLAVITQGTGGFLSDLGPRLTGWFGEPGIFAASCALSGAIELWRRKRFTSWQLIAALGVLCSQSTGGVIALLTVWSVWLLLHLAKRVGTKWTMRLVGLGVAALSIALIFGSSFLGLAAKRSINASALTDRFGEFTPSQLAAHWVMHPLGVPQGSSLQEINLIGSSLTYGPLVVILACALLIYWPFRLRVLRGLMPLSMAVLVTIIFAQPAWKNPLWFAVFAFALGWASATEAVNSVGESQPASRAKDRSNA